MTPQETLLYWIKERYLIFVRKETGQPRPWSDDPVFQRTYFCNVHRENDRVTRWIREFYSPFVDDDMFEYNIVLSRFLNWPSTLERLGYLRNHEPHTLLANLESLSSVGKIWGNAYVITTHGMKMPKAQYLAHDVLGAVYSNLEGLRAACRGHGSPPTCRQASSALQCIDGIGSFLSGQIIADLKNTIGHPLSKSADKRSFVVPGPGSLRGVSWFRHGHPGLDSPAGFERNFQEIREYVSANWPMEVPPVDNQDLQNCLCEYDKYMRVKTGSGRSKRGYNGS